MPASSLTGSAEISIGQGMLSLGANVSYFTDAQDGAALSMPGEDNRIFSVYRLGDVVEYIECNPISWFKFLDGQKWYGLKNGDLYFLMGCYKTY